jgi:hypothetical protein
VGLRLPPIGTGVKAAALNPPPTTGIFFTRRHFDSELRP